jgi:hypothetical protein
LEVRLRQSRRPFGGIERRGTVYRARYHGPDGCRYEAPHLFVARIDAEHWLAEVHRDIASDVWRPPQKETVSGHELESLSGGSLVTAGMVERYQHANKTARARLAENMSKLADRESWTSR